MKTRWYILTLILLVGMIGLGSLDCSNTGNNTVTDQGGETQTEAILKGQIFSNLTPGKGTKTCPFTCTVSFLAGANNTPQNEKVLESIPFRCDAEGTPETGQGFEVKIPIDLGNPQIQGAAIFQATCSRNNSTFLSEYSGSVPFQASSCKNSEDCYFTIDLTNPLDQLDQSGVLDFLLTLPCTTLMFLQQFCEVSEAPSEEPGFSCTLLGLALTVLECFGGGEGCGNGLCEEGEDNFNDPFKFCFEDCACKGNLARGGDCECETKEECFAACSGQGGTICGPVSLPDNFNDTHCTCTTCKNGVYEPELGEGCDVSDPHGTEECFANENAACDGTTCECFNGGAPSCGNEVVEPTKGEQCDTGVPFEPGTCPSGYVCDAFECKCTQCGNRTVDAGENCDVGGFIEPTTQCGPLTNNLVCKQCLCTSCGNGTVDPGEECDVNGDLANWSAACGTLGFCPDNCRDCACGGQPSCGVCPAPPTPSDPLLTCIDGCCVPMITP